MATHANGYPIGASVWQELHVPHTDGVANFYKTILDWDLQLDGDRGVFTLAGDTVAGIVVNPALEGPAAGWRVFLGADDLGTAVARAEAAGSRVLETDVELVIDGDAVWLEDPFGAPFGLAVPAAGQAVPVSNDLGKLSLVDPTNHDVQAQVEFQLALFPDNFADEILEGDVCFIRDEEGLALRGSFEVAPEVREFLPPHWLPWFNVADQARAIELAEQAGGTVNTRDNDSRFGTWGVVVDPAGGVWKALQQSVQGLTK